MQMNVPLRWMGIAGVLVVVTAFPVPAVAGDEASQFGQILKRAQQFRDVDMSDEEVRRLGAAVSERIRARYGVVQDPAVHRYVTLVGTVLARESEESDYDWQFIVLDTDGVNALAAPGGFIHITRGALALMASEAELAGVLGHEIIHVTEKHTIRAIQKGKLVEIGSDETLAGNTALFNRLVDKATDVVMAGFGRSEELEADEKGIELADEVGYAPAGLSSFLRTLSERNRSSQQKQGLFASHPEMQERLDRIGERIEDEKLDATATLEPRFASNISYEPVPITEIVTVEGGAAGLTDGEATSEADASGKDENAAKAEEPKEKAEEPKKKGGFGLSRLMDPLGGGSQETRSAEVTGSGGARGVDSEREARGGSNPSPVPVTVTAADIEAFKKEGQLN